MGIFTPRVTQEIMRDMTIVFLDSTNLNDLNYGSIWSIIMEAAALEDDEQYFQMIEIVKGYSIDSAIGADLNNRAFEYGLERRNSSYASTYVTLGDSAIVKVSTSVYSGLEGAASGTREINGDSAENFPVSGSIIIGRGTPNEEFVAYTSITTQTNYVTFNLGSELAYDHGTDETIILSQGGDRLFSAGLLVKVPVSDQLEQVFYEIEESATIPDGEEYIDEVYVICTELGTKGNVPVGAISQFATKPFGTAWVKNPYRVTNALDKETDPELRDRIKSHIQSLSKGTVTAIKNGVSGVVSEDDNKRVVSVSVREPTIPADVVRMFIDDGTGFISTYEKIGFEVLAASATGGEKYLDIPNVPVVKAFSETEASEPFAISNNTTLIVEVGGVQETITFFDSDFSVPLSATAQEVLAVINSRSELFEGRLSSDGDKLRIFSRSNINERIGVTGGGANDFLSFPIDEKHTIALFLERDGRIYPLSKDGSSSRLEASFPATYDFSEEKFLSLVIDGKDKNIQKVVFNPSSFGTPNSATPEEVKSVFDDALPGASALVTSGNTRISLESLLKFESSKLKVLGVFGSVLVNGSETSGLDSLGSQDFYWKLQGDFIHVGADTRFDTIKVYKPASNDPELSFEYYDQVLGWTALEVIGDISEENPTIRFFTPQSWSKVDVLSFGFKFWVRMQRNSATSGSTVLEAMTISDANFIFGFREDEVSGTSADYTMNRFLGQIEFATPLQKGDRITLGCDKSRAFVISSLEEPFQNVQTAGDLEVYIDENLYPVTFDDSMFSDPILPSASEVAAAISAAIVGGSATAIDKTVYIQTNNVNGSIQIADSGANSIFEFPTDQIYGVTPHNAYLISDFLASFTFNADDSILMIVDENYANSFTVPCFYQEEIVTVTSDTEYVIPALNQIFVTASELEGFDIVVVSGDQEGERRSITTYDPATGTITLNLSVVLAEGDKIQVLPKTPSHIVSFWNNKRVTLLSTVAYVERVGAAVGGVQIMSKTLGEASSIIITGGTGNAELNFASSSYGKDAYRHHNGLAREVQWIVDGNDSDREKYEGIRAAGVQVEVLEPFSIPVSVTINVTTREGISLSSVTDDVKSAVANYINRLSVGDDVILSEIIVSVKSVSGVFDAKIRTPSENIPIADNELSTIKESDIGVI